MKKWRILLLVLGLSFAVRAGEPRIAIFDEPDFPNASTRNAEFYRKITGGTILRLSELDQIGNFDILIFPHGGYLPAEAESAVSNLFRRGGCVIVTGDLQTPPPAPPEKRPSGYLARIDFDKRYGVPSGGPLTKQNGRWIPVATSWNYNERLAESWFPEFDLKGWPNRAQSYGGSYMRPFDETLQLNSKLQNSGLPAAIPPPSDKVSLARLVPGGDTGDYALDAFLPLYLFDAPSGRPYAPFKSAGKSQEDRAADAFIYRKFRPDAFGATLVMMGRAGRELLDSPQGEQTFRALLKLLAKPLPGELPHNYIRRVHALEQTVSDYNDCSAKLFQALCRKAETELSAGRSPEPYLIKLKSLRREANRINDRLSGLQGQKDLHQKIAGPGLSALEQELQRRLPEIKKVLAQLPSGKPVDHGPAKHPYQELQFSASGFGPWSLQADAKWKRVQELGITAVLSDLNWDRMKILQERYGLRTFAKTVINTRRFSDKKTVESAILQPDQGRVKTAKVHVWTPESKETADSFQILLPEVASNPAIAGIIQGDERDMEWSLWGPYMHRKFLAWLKQKYTDISALNREYESSYPDFEAIQLPLKRPETLQEHALWEDWTRYREIYRIQEEMQCWVDQPKQLAPGKMMWMYGSYHLQGIHPANGVNYYEYGKLVDPASLESGSLAPRKEVVANDITAFGKKHVNPEWSNFYFPSGSAGGDRNRMRQGLWKEAGAGTIGWYLFMGGLQRGKWNSAPLLTPNGMLTPVGAALREVTGDFHAARSLFLDGQRAEPAVRILYSPTTRRHTSWPGIEGDRSIESATGYSEAFRQLHIPARAIDEQAIMEGKLPAECCFLFVPVAEYLNRTLMQELRKFMEQGGTVVASPDAGTFDQYGHRRDYLAELAGVRAVPVQDPVFKTISAKTLRILFPNETKVLLNGADGKPAVSVTKVGQGQLVLCGWPIGGEFNTSGNGLNELRRLVNALPIPRPYQCDDDHFVIRPWTLNDSEFLVCHYLERQNVKPAANGFPLASPPVMAKVKLQLAGTFAVEDWLSGLPLPAQQKDGITTVNLLIGNPGGKILKLTRSGSQTGVFSPLPEEKSNTVIQHQQRKYPLPWSGRIFAEWGKVQFGSYEFSCHVETGGAWQGKVFAQFSRDGRTLRRECTPGTVSVFRFEQEEIVLNCKDVSAVMPAYVEGSIRVRPLPKLQGKLLEEENGKLLFRNAFASFTVLPEFGGRIAELRLAEDSPNQLQVYPEELAKGKSSSYRNYGGIEYNPGYYQGPGWQIPFAYEILKNTSEEAEVLLKRSVPFSLQKGGKISWEIVYRFRADSPVLRTELRLFNEAEGPDRLALRTHPIFVPGGLDTGNSVFCYVSPSGPATLPFRTNRNEYAANAGGWIACLDQNAREGILQLFDPAVLPKLYLWTGSGIGNVELHPIAATVPQGKSLNFTFGIAPVAGFDRIDEVRDGLMICMNAGDFRIAALQPVKVQIQGELRSGTKVLEQFQKELNLNPGYTVPCSLKTNPETLPDGSYELNITCGKTVFSKRFDIQKEQQKRADSDRKKREKRLQELLQEYQQNPDSEKRREIFRLSAPEN